MQSQIAITLLGQVPIALEGLSRILGEHGFTVVDIASDLQALKPEVHISQLIVDKIAAKFRRLYTPCFSGRGF